MTRTPMTSLACLVAVASFGATVLSTSVADAGRVVVLAIQGDPEGELEDGLISIVEDRHDLVTSGEFDRAARKSGVDDLDGPAIGKLARKLGADAVIEGSVSREDEGFLLVVRIRGANGKTVKKISVDLARRRLSSKAKKRLGTGVLDGVDKVLGIAGEERLDDSKAEAARKPAKKQSKAELKAEKAEQARVAKAEKAAQAKAAKAEKARLAKAAKADKAEQARTKARAKKAAREVADDEPEMDDVAEDDGEDDDEDADQDGDRRTRRVAARDVDDDLDDEVAVRRGSGAGAGRDARRPAVRIEAGPSAIARELTFTSRPGFDQAPRGYTTTLVPGARVAGEVYPLAFGDPGTLAAGLGVGFELDQTLSAKARTSDAPEVPLPVTQLHWEVSARYRHAFGDKATLPSVTVGIGYGRRAYGVDRGGLPAGAKLDIPDVDYTMIAPSLMLRVPLGSRLALGGSGKALLIRSAGPVQSTDSYGGARITGFEAAASVEVRITGSVLASLGGSMTQIGYDFIGNGAETNNRDLDPASQDIGGMGDRYLGVVGTVGYRY